MTNYKYIKCTVYFFLAILMLFSISSCYLKDPSFHDNNIKRNIINSDYTFTDVHENAVDSMLGSCNIYIDKQKPIIVASLVDIDNMKKSSTLGRMSSEIVAGRLSQQGFRVQEVKMSQSDIFVSEAEGEMILSRNLHQIGKKHDVQGFVVGTYAIGKYHRSEADVFVALRFIDTNNIIGCSVNYVVLNTDPRLWK